MIHVTAGELVPEQAHRPRHRKPDELAILPVGDAAGQSYEDLYVEHAPAARAVALSMVPRDVADDIVAEAFTRVLKAIRAGGGPGQAFRAYLLTAVRNTANDWLRASRRVTAVGDVENDLEDRVPEENLGLARLSRGPEAEAEARVEAQLVARAFGKLPARWQAVLWQLEVEARAPAAVAPGFGLTANGVSALAVRAREGLRQAYLAEHVGANIPDACRSYAEALSADTRGRLSRRRQAAVHDHLNQCQSCHSLAGELTELNSRLGAILTPALLAMSMGASGHELLGLTPAIGARTAAKTNAMTGKAAAKTKAAAGAKTAAGAKAGVGAKVGLGAKAVLSTQWRMWRLHPLTAAVTATAGLAAAGGMVFAVGVSPMSPFRQPAQPQQVTERPAAASAQVSEPTLGGSRSAAGQPAGTASSAASSAAGGVVLPTGTDGAAGQAAGGTGYGTGTTGSDEGTGASGSTGSSSAAHPVQSLVGGVGSAAQGVTSGLGNTVQGVTSGLGNTVQGVTGGVGSTVQGVTSGLGNTVQGATSGVGGVVQGVASGAGATVAGVGQTVNGVTQGLGGAVDQTTTGLGNIISGTTKAVSGGNATLTAVGDAAGSLVQGVGDTVSGATGAVGSTVGGATSSVGNVTSGVGAAASNAVAGTGAAANNVVSGVGSAASGVVSGTGAGANGVVSGLGSAASNAVSGTGAAANGAVSGVGSTTNGLVSTVGAGVSGLLGGGKS